MKSTFIVCKYFLHGQMNELFQYFECRPSMNKELPIQFVCKEIYCSVSNRKRQNQTKIYFLGVTDGSFVAQL